MMLDSRLLHRKLNRLHFLFAAYEQQIPKPFRLDAQELLGGIDELLRQDKPAHWDAADILLNYEAHKQAVYGPGPVADILRNSEPQGKLYHAVEYFDGQTLMTERHSGPPKWCDKCEALKQQYGPMGDVRPPMSKGDMSPPKPPAAPRVGGRVVTIGRIVRFVDRSCSEYPAIIVEVDKDNPGLVRLVVFAPGYGASSQRDPVPYFDTSRIEYTWHWPDAAENKPHD